MTILLFGASGRTGKLVLQKALDAGYKVISVVRNPDALLIKHAHHTVVRGDVRNARSFSTAMQGADMVISCIGPADLKPTDLLSAGAANILQAMREAGVARIICQSAAGIEASPKLPWLLRVAGVPILQRVLRHVYADTRRMEALLVASGLHWTAVRPPRLTNGKPTGHYRYAVSSWLERCTKITRADLASYIVEHANDAQTYQSVVEVAN